MELTVRRLGLVDSTNERAFAALAAGEARHGELFVASGQSAGRGRLGRRWESAEGEGLYASLVLAPDEPDARGAPPAPALTMAAGLAVLDAVRALGLGRARLDWPNDLVVGEPGAGAKLAGILVESRGLDPARPRYVVGIGLDVAQRAFAPELVRERAVTSLALQGLACTVEDALAALVAALPARMEQALRAEPRLASDFLAGLELSGRRVRVEEASGARVGVLRGLELGRGLELELAEPRGERAWVALERVRALEPL